MDKALEVKDVLSVQTFGQMHNKAQDMVERFQRNSKLPSTSARTSTSAEYGIPEGSTDFSRKGVDYHQFPNNEAVNYFNVNYEPGAILVYIFDWYFL